MTQIEVTFDIDANGILHVTAKDKNTGKENKITIKANSGLTEEEIQRMVKDAEANAAEDKKALELVTARNTADALAHSTKKALEEHGASLDAGEKEKIEAALKENILCFNVESRSELIRIEEVAKKINLKAPISIRVNPDVDAKTHPYISTGLKDNKFGVDFNQALALYLEAKSMGHIEVKGIDCHIGSQITELKPFVDALDRVLSLVDQLKKRIFI